MLPATSVLRASNGLRRPIARSLVSHLQCKLVSFFGGTNQDGFAHGHSARSTTTDAYKYVPGGRAYSVFSSLKESLNI